jgi:hypothetical protein
MACSTLAVTGRKVYVIRRPDVAQTPLESEIAAGRPITSCFLSTGSE